MIIGRSFGEALIIVSSIVEGLFILSGQPIDKKSHSASAFQVGDSVEEFQVASSVKLLFFHFPKEKKNN